MYFWFGREQRDKLYIELMTKKQNRDICLAFATVLITLFASMSSTQVIFRVFIALVLDEIQFRFKRR